MRDVDAAWLAAAIDGEGCVGIYKYKTRTYFHLEVCNTHLEFLEKCRLISGGGYIRVKSKKTENHKKSYVFSISEKKKALEVLDFIYPYLIVKKTRVRYVISWLKKYMLRTKGNFYDVERHRRAGLISAMSPNNHLKGNRGNSEMHRLNSLCASKESNAKKGNRGNGDLHKKNALRISKESNARKGNRGNVEQHKLAGLARWNRKLNSNA